jgi:hypothetical protein
MVNGLRLALCHFFIARLKAGRAIPNSRFTIAPLTPACRRAVL